MATEPGGMRRFEAGDSTGDDLAGSAVGGGDDGDEKLTTEKWYGEVQPMLSQLLMMNGYEGMMLEMFAAQLESAFENKDAHSLRDQVFVAPLAP